MTGSHRPLSGRDAAGAGALLLAVNLGCAAAGAAIGAAVGAAVPLALAGFGTPDADAAKPDLLKAVGDASSADKPQICWALPASNIGPGRRLLSRDERCR